MGKRGYVLRPAAWTKRPSDTSPSQLLSLSDFADKVTKPLELFKVKTAFKTAVSDTTANYKDCFVLSSLLLRGALAFSLVVLSLVFPHAQHIDRFV